MASGNLKGNQYGEFPLSFLFFFFFLRKNLSNDINKGKRMDAIDSNLPKILVDFHNLTQANLL